MDLLKQLKDIKPNVQITDYRFYIFLILAAVIIAAAAYFIFRHLKKRSDPYLIKLQNLDYGNSKKTAYEFTEYAKHFINDKNREIYAEILTELEKYKYRPDVDTLDENTANKIKKFIEDIK